MNNEMNILVLRGVYVTEKAVHLLKNNQITFKVSLSANKQSIKYCVEKIFNFHVLDVSTIILKKKQVKTFKYGKKCYRSKWKKAIVSVKNIFTSEVINSV